MLGTPYERTSDLKTSSVTPLKRKSPITSMTDRSHGRSPLSYAIEDMRVNFKDENLHRSKANIRSLLNTQFMRLSHNAQRSSLNSERPSAVDYKTPVFGKILSGLQNSRITVSNENILRVTIGRKIIKENDEGLRHRHHTKT